METDKCFEENDVIENIKEHKSEEIDEGGIFI